MARSVTAHVHEISKMGEFPVMCLHRNYNLSRRMPWSLHLVSCVPCVDHWL